MFQAMPLQYFKDDGFNRGRFKMTHQNEALNLKIVIFGILFRGDSLSSSHFCKKPLLSIIAHVTRVVYC